MMKASANALSHSGVRVSTRGVGHSFGELDLLVGLDLELPPHTVLGLVGPLGCGKSTPLEILCGLREPSAGGVVLDDQTDAALRRSNRGIRPAAARREAAELFGNFGPDGFQRTQPSRLSGGMRQRVAFLRTLLSGKPVLAPDEPFAALDAITPAQR